MKNKVKVVYFENGKEKVIYAQTNKRKDFLTKRLHKDIIPQNSFSIIKPVENIPEHELNNIIMFHDLED